MKVIDTHLHLDSKKYSHLREALEALVNEMRECQIERAVLLHLETQPWSLEEYAKLIPYFPEIIFFANIDPFRKDSQNILKRAIQEYGFKGFKIHPRLNSHPVFCKELIELIQIAGKNNVPSIIDAFPDGSFLMNGFDPIDYAKLAQECSDSKIIWAHFGGHYCLDFMMMAKRLANIYLDFSYTLLYFKGSHIPLNLSYAFKSMRYEKIFYGSDYPDRNLKDSLYSSIELLDNLGVPKDVQEKLLYKNANEFLKVNCGPI